MEFFGLGIVTAIIFAIISGISFLIGLVPTFLKILFLIVINVVIWALLAKAKA